MTQAVGGATPAIAVELQSLIGENGVKELTVRDGEEPISRLWLVSFNEPLKRPHDTRHTFAVTDATFPAHLDDENCFAACGVIFDLDITVFEPCGLIGPKSRVRHEQHIVVELLT